MVGGLILVAGTQAYAAGLYGSGVVNVQLGAGSTSSSATSGMSGMAGMTMTSTDLSAQVQAGMIDASSSDAIVNLQGNVGSLIVSAADVSAYNNMVIQARPAVRTISVQSDGSVAVGYSQPAKFLGIFSASLSGTVNVDAEGNTTVQLPWYAFLYSKDTTEVQASAATAVQQSGASFGAQADTATNAQNSVRIVNAVTAAVQSQISGSAAANVDANTNTNASAGY